MKLLFLHFGSFSKINGSLIKAFQERQIEVVSSDISTVIQFKPSPKNFFFNSLYSFVSYGPNWQLGLEYTPYAFSIMTQRCRKLTTFNKYDAIFQTQTLFACPSTSLATPYFIYTDHTHSLTIAAKRRGYDAKALRARNTWIALEKGAYSSATTLFAMSDYIRNSLLTHYGVHENKVFTVYPGINVKTSNYHSPRHTEKVILFVGIDFERKGGHLLLKAFRDIKREVPDAKLVIVGCNIEVNDTDIVVKGRLPPDRVADEYMNADLFVMPSLREPFGIVFLEAMAAGLPCIGTRIESIPEIIVDGENGYLVNPNSITDLVDKITQLLKNPDLLKRMGETARKRGRSFTWEHTVDNLLRYMVL